MSKALISAMLVVWVLNLDNLYAQQDAATPSVIPKPAPGALYPTKKDDEDVKRDDTKNMMRSRVDPTVVYYYEDSKISKSQRNSWEMGCRRKFKDFEDQKKCFDRRVKRYMDAAK